MKNVVDIQSPEKEKLVKQKQKVGSGEENSRFLLLL